jgi:predicted nucleic acid-binding protein
MRAPVSFDASTLINFHQAGSTVLLAQHFRGRALVAGHIEDVELGVHVHEMVAFGGVRWIDRVDIAGAKDLRRVARLQTLLGSVRRHRGEAEAMVICEDRGAILATDDRDAALVARSRRLRVATTVDILNLLTARNHLAREQAVAIAVRMQQAGQNVDPADIG